MSNETFRHISLPFLSGRSLLAIRLINQSNYNLIRSVRISKGQSLIHHTTDIIDGRVSSFTRRPMAIILRLRMATLSSRVYSIHKIPDEIDGSCLKSIRINSFDFVWERRLKGYDETMILHILIPLPFVRCLERSLHESCCCCGCR